MKKLVIDKTNPIIIKIENQSGEKYNNVKINFSDSNMVNYGLPTAITIQCCNIGFDYEALLKVLKSQTITVTKTFLYSTCSPQHSTLIQHSNNKQITELAPEFDTKDIIKEIVKNNVSIPPIAWLTTPFNHNKYLVNIKSHFIIQEILPHSHFKLIMY